MPAYNTEKFVREALRSLFAQKCQDFEIIFIDDGSEDATALIARDALEAWGGRYTFISQRNQGPGKARNTGMTSANGDYLYFLDSDDIAGPELFSCVREIIKDDPDVVITGWSRIDEDGNVLNGQGGGIPCASFPRDHAKCLMMHLEGRFPFWTGGFFVKRSLVKGNSLSFPEDLLPLEDILFMSECLLCAASVKTVTEALSMSRKRLSSITHGKNFMMEVIRANIGYSLRVISFIRNRMPEKVSTVGFIEKRMRVFFLLLLREYLRTGKNSFFRMALKEKTIRGVIEDIMKSGRYEIEDRVKAGILIYAPGLYKLRYQIKYRK